MPTGADSGGALAITRLWSGSEMVAAGMLDWGTADGPDSGLVLHQEWTQSKHRRNPCLPAQSCGVWEVHEAMVIGPNPEQRVQRSVI